MYLLLVLDLHFFLQSEGQPEISSILWFTFFFFYSYVHVINVK